MHAAALLLAVLAAGADRPAPAKAKPAAARPALPRNTGMVTGRLASKGCPGPVAGATVIVMGRDAATTSDSEGRFSLTLPPGTYSLAFRGPNLVADQRLDEVSVLLGQSRDLGAVELWPEEPPPSCEPAAPGAAPAEEPLVAVAPDAPQLELPGSAVAPAQAREVWVRGSPGTAPGQFGLQGNPARDDEDALGPPSFAVGPLGSLYVLDALNGRIQRFDPKGRPTGAFPLVRPAGGTEVEADLAVGEDGQILVFTGGDQPFLSQYDPAGRLLLQGALPPSFRGVDFLFAGRPRPLFLMQNGQAVRAELGWGGLKAEGPLPGLPVGELHLQAERAGRWIASLRFFTASGRLLRGVQLHSRVPIARVRLVGVSRRGEMVVAVDRAEGPDDRAPQGEVLLLSVTPQGALTGAQSVPPGDRRFEFREFAIAPDGAVVQMQSDAAEVRFVRWALPPPPREAVAGVGMLRGRVTESGRPAAGAAVTVGRSRRVVPVAADGSFEARLPAGTYLVAIRPGGQPEASPVEIKVAVAAGATVDLGTVALSQARPGGGGGR
ncbi:MAG TPA: carboxypeptidase regulatory-like domain-containing protein [Anaeromyxobacteraceae bacterium]|nr:carboxypeptidase regulatory-like domain-containing protein [Anaeromyxobacteraceae bacterium]